MTRVLIGMVLGMSVMAAPVWALRINRPDTFAEWTPESMAKLNDTLTELFNLTNGRYTKDIVTSSPNGSRTGQAGESILYNNAGSWKECHNIDGGLTWRCDDTALTAP